MKLRFVIFLFSLLLTAANALAQEAKKNETLYRTAGDTLTAVEMNRGDTLKFKLRNGQTRTLVLEETAARILLTNLKEIKKAQPDGGTLYHFTARVKIDGHPLTLERYVCAQESFYEPYVINGMRLWFDGVADIFDFVTEKHGDCKPNKAARFAVSDANDRICPPELKPWYPNAANFIDIADTYNGDDCWMGPYQGADAHGGLDINQPRGTKSWAPIDFDDHYLFNSLTKGDNNNRSRATRKWANGELWTLQLHHLINLLVPERTPIKAGTHYAEAAGVHVGNNDHSHFIFKITPRETGQLIDLDPWIIFWQIFEDNKKRAGAIRANIAPLGPAKTGQAVVFNSAASRKSPAGERLSYHWTFGDGGWSSEANPSHTFTRPGIYPVNLTIDDGAEQATFTQHITVDGEKVNKPALALSAPDEVTFRRRPTHAMDVYGAPVRHLPHTLYFTARAARPTPNVRTIALENVGGATLGTAAAPRVTYQQGTDWLKVELEGRGNEQKLRVGVDAAGLQPGQYAALVKTEVPGALNAAQGFSVVLRVPTNPAEYRVARERQFRIVDNASPGFYATPYFWVGHRFKKWQERGYQGFYLTNGGRAAQGEFARFTPELEAGRYEVALHPETPFALDARFAVRVRHRGGEQTVWVEPAKSRVIGAFDFDEGADGFVEILAAGSTGQVFADAVTFKRVEADKARQ